MREELETEVPRPIEGHSTLERDCEAPGHGDLDRGARFQALDQCGVAIMLGDELIEVHQGFLDGNGRDSATASPSRRPTADRADAIAISRQRRRPSLIGRSPVKCPECAESPSVSPL